MARVHPRRWQTTSSCSEGFWKDRTLRSEDEASRDLRVKLQRKHEPRRKAFRAVRCLSDPRFQTTLNFVASLFQCPRRRARSLILHRPPYRVHRHGGRRKYSTPHYSCTQRHNQQFKPKHAPWKRNAITVIPNLVQPVDGWLASRTIRNFPAASAWRPSPHDSIRLKY